MRTGIFDRTYETLKDYWVVRGFSKKSNCYVYPNEGWSWTEWTREVTDTYKSLKDAKHAIDGGYLYDMIETQQIVDIEFLHYKSTRQVVQHEEIVAYDENGNPSTAVEPAVIVENWTIRPDDYIGLTETDEDDLKIYGHVKALRDGKAYIRVLNGAWTMVLKMEGDRLFTDETCDSGQTGLEIKVLFQGVPDPHGDPGCYDTQMDAWRAQQEAKAP